MCVVMLLAYVWRCVLMYSIITAALVVDHVYGRNIRQTSLVFDYMRKNSIPDETRGRVRDYLKLQHAQERHKEDDFALSML